MSNTKLNAFQKTELQLMRDDVAASGGRKAVYFDRDTGVTVAMMVPEDYEGETEKARTAFVAISVASADEEKFRRKVGEFQALGMLENGESFLARVPFDAWDEFAVDTAYAMAAYRDNF